MVAGVFMLGLGSGVHAETLELLTWKGYAPKSLVEKFEKETGITVKTTFSNNEEMIAKLRATRGAGFDLAQPSQDRISSVQEKYNIYQPIDMAKINTGQIIGKEKCKYWLIGSRTGSAVRSSARPAPANRTS